MTTLETEKMVCVYSKKEAGITRSQGANQEQHLSGSIYDLWQGSQTGRWQRVADKGQREFADTLGSFPYGALMDKMKWLSELSEQLYVWIDD